MIKGLEHLSLEERLRDVENGWLRGNPINVRKYLTGRKK